MPDRTFDIQNHVLAALLDHWGLDRPDVVAHDFGGATALRTHLLGSRDYHSLMLIDPVALSPWGSPFVRHVRRHEAAFSLLPPAIHAAVVGAYVSGAAVSALPPDVLAAYVDPWCGETGQAAFYRQIAQMDERYTDEIADLLARVRTPTLILWGEDDAWIPPDRGKALAALIPAARIPRSSHAGHLVQEDAPEVVVASLMSFLAETEGRDAAAAVSPSR